MKRMLIKNTAIFSVLLAILFYSQTAIAQLPQDTLRLTLSQALEIALSENLTVKVADQEITKQEYAKKGTYASLFPQIDFSGSYQRTIKKQTMYIDNMPGMEEVSGMDKGFKAGRDNSWSVGFNASVPLISAPLWNSLKISGFDVELAVEKARSSRIDMVDQVKQTFYSVLLSGDAYIVFKEAYDNAVRNYNDIKQKYEQGLLAEYDLIRANVNVKNAEPNMYDAENSLILASWQLKALMGIDLELNIKCIETLTDYEDRLIEYSSLTDVSLDDNSNLKQIDIQHKQLEQIRKMNMAQYYPTLSASFSYQWMSMNNNFKFKDYNWDPFSTVGVTLSVPIFSGGKRYSDIKQSQVSLMQLSDQRMDVERNLRLAIKQSIDQMNTCIKQYRAALAGVEESGKGYAITMKRYETGEGTLLEINDSQLSMTQAKLNLNQSIYNYLTAKSILEKTLGSTNEY